MFLFYEIGGKVRDELMGIKSKDIDYTVVSNNPFTISGGDVDDMFEDLVKYLKSQGFEIFLTTPDCYTIRAKFPVGHKNEGIVADFVLARKEAGYIPGTRKPLVFPGSLYDDQIRRDFTVNTIAKDETGHLIDPFYGRRDIELKLLRTPLPVEQTFDDDPLRILRAIRFSITKNFEMIKEMKEAIYEYDFFDKMSIVSEERIREELHKCMKDNWFKTMNYLEEFPILKKYLYFRTQLWFKPTLEK